MEIRISGRRTGKTTECIRRLRENPDALMFVLNTSMARTLPKDIQKQVFSINSSSWIGKPFKKVIIDNIDFMKKDVLRKIKNSFEIILVTASFSPKTITHLWQLFGETDNWGYCPDCDRPDCDNCDQRMPDEPTYNEGYD